MVSPETLLSKSKGIRPSPQAQLMSLSNKMQKQTEEIRQCAAEAFSYHTAALHNRLPQTLISLMKKVDLLYGHLSELNHIKAEIAAMYNDLKSIKKKLEEKGEILT